MPPPPPKSKAPPNILPSQNPTDDNLRYIAQTVPPGPPPLPKAGSSTGTPEPASVVASSVTAAGASSAGSVLPVQNPVLLQPSADEPMTDTNYRSLVMPELLYLLIYTGDEMYPRMANHKWAYNSFFYIRVHDVVRVLDTDSHTGLIRTDVGWVVWRLLHRYNGVPPWTIVTAPGEIAPAKATMDLVNFRWQTIITDRRARCIELGTVLGACTDNMMIEAVELKEALSKSWQNAMTQNIIFDNMGFTRSGEGAMGETRLPQGRPHSANIVAAPLMASSPSTSQFYGPQEQNAVLMRHIHNLTSLLDTKSTEIKGAHDLIRTYRQDWRLAHTQSQILPPPPTEYMVAAIAFPAPPFSEQTAAGNRAPSAVTPTDNYHMYDTVAQSPQPAIIPKRLGDGIAAQCKEWLRITRPTALETTKYVHQLEVQTRGSLAVWSLSRCGGLRHLRIFAVARISELNPNNEALAEFGVQKLVDCLIPDPTWLEANLVVDTLQRDPEAQTPREAWNWAIQFAPAHHLSASCPFKDDPSVGKGLQTYYLPYKVLVERSVVAYEMAETLVFKADKQIVPVVRYHHNQFTMCDNVTATPPGITIRDIDYVSKVAANMVLQEQSGFGVL